MPEKDKFHTALHYSSLGQMQIASEIFWDVYMTTKNLKLKLQTIHALVTTLNHLKDNSKIQKICSEGIILANRLGAYDSKAYLLAKKAHCLTIDVYFCLHKRKNLVLAPGWKGFALESKKKDYEDLTEKIDSSGKEADILLNESFQIAEQIDSKETEANILMFKGEIFAEKYLNFKMDNMKLTKMRLFLKKLTSNDFFFFNRKDHNKMNIYMTTSKKNYLQSARIFDSIGDELGVALSIINLSSYLNAAGRRREAKKGLNNARKIAVNHKDIALLSRVDKLTKSIKQKTATSPHDLKRDDNKFSTIA